MRGRMQDPDASKDALNASAETHGSPAFCIKLDDQTELRLLKPEDAAELFNLIDQNRKFLGRWFDMVDITRDPADTYTWIVGMLARREEDRTRGWAGIFHQARLVGCVGVTESEPQKHTAEIGYYLSADACGRGLATRACRSFVQYLFEQRGIHRIGLRVASDNTRSIRLAERLGFTCEGRLREADVFEGVRRDVVVFGLLRKEWASARQEGDRVSDEWKR